MVQGINLKLILLISSILILNLVGASFGYNKISSNAEAGNFGTFKQNDCVKLLQTCSNCTYVNISSVIYPNSTQVLGLVKMTKIGTEYNYTFCNATQLGTYTVNGFGDDDGVIKIFIYDFEITPLGSELTTGKGILYVVFLIGGLFIFLLCLYGAVKIPYRNPRTEDDIIIGLNDLKYVKIFLMVLSYLILMSILGLLKGITYNFLFDLGIYKFFQWIYWIMFALLWPLIVCGFLFALILFINDKKIQKALARGVQIR